MPHILGNFQKALDKINDNLSRMASLTQANLECAVRGLLERNSDLCNQVVADDEEIDQMEMKIDQEGLEIIALYNPVASDLRQVVSVMKVASNLERVADQAVGIAKRARKMNKSAEVPETRMIEPIYEKAISLLRDSIAAFRNHELKDALDIKARDEEIDTAYKELAKRLTERMEENPADIRVYLDLQFIVRFVERVGDHAKNIGEDAVFAESAMDIRHGAERPEVE